MLLKPNMNYQNELKTLVDDVVNDSEIVVAGYYMNKSVESTANFIRSGMNLKDLSYTIGIAIPPDVSSFHNVKQNVILLFKSFRDENSVTFQNYLELQGIIGFVNYSPGTLFLSASIIIIPVLFHL